MSSPVPVTTHLGSAIRILDEAVAEHKPVAVYAMFSGGHDSLATAAVATQHPAFTACVHVNTGIGIEATRDFVRATCAEQGWPLMELHPPGKTYDEFVIEHGFPGGAGHRYAYSWLKERALDKLIRETKRRPSDRVVLVTGVRRQESARRMGHVQPVLRVGATVWVAPLIDWSAREVGDCIAERGLARNPVVDTLHMSGECLCGAMAKRGELAWIIKWYPEVGQRIADLQERVRAAGKPRSLWGSEEIISPGQLPLCWSCEARVSTDVA